MWSKSTLGYLNSLRKIDSVFENGSNLVSIATILTLVEKVLGSL